MNNVFYTFLNLLVVEIFNFMTAVQIANIFTDKDFILIKWNILLAILTIIAYDSVYMPIFN